MKRFVGTLFLFFVSISLAMAQGSVRGKVKDKKTDEPLGFVNVVISPRGETKLVKGAVTDLDGAFDITDLPPGNYTLTLSFVGYKDLTRQFAVTTAKPATHYNVLYMSEDSHQLQEVTVTGQRSSMKLEVDRKSFDVTQDIANAGGAASDVLENIPSVEVDNDGNISLRGNTSVEVWINGRASGLTADNRAQILQQLPAESIERIEVIDNPSAKFSAEGSAGIINIVLKKDRKAGYYGSIQAGGNTRGSAHTSFNINYNSSALDAYFNVGFRHRQNNGGGSYSYQEYLTTNQYQSYRGSNDSRGNNLFSRGGLTWHATQKDDFSVGGMFMIGGNNNLNITPYHYGILGTDTDTQLMLRRNTGDGDMRMMHGEFNYRHNFTDKHFLDFVVEYNNWRSDNDNFYQDSTTYYDGVTPTTYTYQYRPAFIRNRSWEVRLDYENPISETILIQAGYNGRFSHENTPQESWIDNNNWDGRAQEEDKPYYNRFIYDMDVHSLYFTSTMKFGNFGVMAGLRGEYWKVNTESYDWYQERDASLRDKPFKKDYFQLFPSVFLSYQLTENDQLQLNYTRRLRRPWGGQLNSFRNTRDASMVEFGNPELTPEFSNSFSLNYLRTWTQHSLLVSAYYRPTTDVMQRIRWQSSTDGMMYQTSKNVAKSLSTGLEVVLKNKFFRILDLTTTANAYYYKINGFSYVIDGQTVTGDENHNFTWNARMQASIILPYDITGQLSGRYRARQVITQGYRKSNFSMEMGIKKNFFNRQLVVSLNCRDLLNSRKWKTYTSGDTFTRYQENWRRGRTVNLTVTWNFGNMTPKRPKEEERRDDGQDDLQQQDNRGGFNAGAAGGGDD
jgi:outer membrane receptor protein involved in Fe transport